MTALPTFIPGAYRYIPGVFQYSGGVVAQPGFQIERVRFRRPMPLDDGFDRIAALIRGAGRPLTSFCACELRSPAPFTEAGFKSFNEQYVGTLVKWGISDGTTNPVARSNVCPELDKPGQPSLYAFSYTVVASDKQNTAPSFVVAGSGECPEGKGNYRDHIIKRGDVSTGAMAEKGRWVVGEMERRLSALGATWKDTTGTQLYTVHNPHPFLATDIVKKGAARDGLTWHYCRPPIVDIEFEMDCRGIAVERVA
jgi:hypothetical protein